MANGRQTQSQVAPETDDYAARAAELDSLRQQLYESNVERYRKEQEASRAYHEAKFQAEKAQLEAQLARSQELAAMAGIEGSAASLLAAAEAQAQPQTVEAPAPEAPAEA